jgi:hypothetical protein
MFTDQLLARVAVPFEEERRRVAGIECLTLLADCVDPVDLDVALELAETFGADRVRRWLKNVAALKGMPLPGRQS